MQYSPKKCHIYYPIFLNFSIQNLLFTGQTTPKHGESGWSALVGAKLPETKRIGISATLIFKGLYVGPKIEALSVLSQASPELKILEKECKKWVVLCSLFLRPANWELYFKLETEIFPLQALFQGKIILCKKSHTKKMG